MILAIGKVATQVGRGVIVAALVAVVVVAGLSRGRFSGGVARLRAGMRNRLARFLVLAGWVWLGWHFFVRTSR